jgi:hypothetical protein
MPLMRDGSASLACALACEVLVVALLVPSRKAHAILYADGLFANHPNH